MGNSRTFWSSSMMTSYEGVSAVRVFDATSDTQFSAKRKPQCSTTKSFVINIKVRNRCETRDEMSEHSQAASCSSPSSGSGADIGVGNLQST